MKLYGTTTSPFVRRVRIVAAELGVPVELVNTATEAGTAELRAISPIRKVPVAVLEGATIYDSRAIIERLIASHGHGHDLPALTRGTPMAVTESNLVNAIDAALDAVIQLFYLRRDGVAIDGTPYAQRQLERADAIFASLSGLVAPDGKGFSGTGMGLAEISVICALDWMEFREAYPTERAAGLASIRSAWGDRPSIVETRPHA